MPRPLYELRFENMVPSQRYFLIEIAYREFPLWSVTAELYQFAAADVDGLRTYLQITYHSDGFRKELERLA
jgi:hypothetical protein